MTYYIDVDGTLTKRQKKGAEPWPEMIEKVRQLIKDGNNVIIWSSTRRYARRFCKTYNLNPILAIGKPEVIVDNQKKKWGNRLKNRVITPEEFLNED